MFRNKFSRTFSPVIGELRGSFKPAGPRKPRETSSRFDGRNEHFEEFEGVPQNRRSDSTQSVTNARDTTLCATDESAQAASPLEKVTATSATDARLSSAASTSAAVALYLGRRTGDLFSPLEAPRSVQSRSFQLIFEWAILSLRVLEGADAFLETHAQSRDARNV